MLRHSSRAWRRSTFRRRSATSLRKIFGILSGSVIRRCRQMARALHLCASPSTRRKKDITLPFGQYPTAGGEAPRQLTKGDHDTTPRWSPDGKFLLFLRSTEKDGKPEPPQLAMLPMAGGDSFVFTDLPRGAGNPVWAPDGKNIAFTSDTNRRTLQNRKRKKARNPPLRRLPPPPRLRRASRRTRQPQLRRAKQTRSTRATCA